MPKLDDSFAFGPNGAGGRGRTAELSAGSAGRRRQVLRLLAVLAIGVVGFAAWRMLRSSEATPGDAVAAGLSGSAVLEIPGPGQVSAAFLPDGRPVFVVQHENGSVSVVDAFSSFDPFGVGYLVGWCEGSHTFDDLHGGAKFDETGRYVVGPAPTGLATYATTVLDGDPPRARVGARQVPAAESDAGRPLFGLACTSGVGTLLHRIPQASLTASPQDAVGGPADRWMAVQAILLVTSDQAPRLCASVDTSAGPSCSRGAPVAGVDGPGLLGGNATYVSEPSVWLVRTDGTQLAHLTLAPGGLAV